MKTDSEVTVTWNSKMLQLGMYLGSIETTIPLWKVLRLKVGKAFIETYEGL